MHYPQHRPPRHHRNRGLPTLPGSGHTHTLPTPHNGRTQATKQHGNKYRPTIPTNSSPPTSPGFGSANTRLEAGRQSQHGDFHPTEINYNTIRQHTQQYVLILQNRRSIHNTITFTVRPPRIRTHPPQGGRCVEPVVENCLAGIIPRHSTSTDSACCMRRGYMLPHGCAATYFAHFGCLPLINSRTTNSAYPCHLQPPSRTGWRLHHLPRQEGQLLITN